MKISHLTASIILIFTLCMGYFYSVEWAYTTEQPDVKAIIGEWVRPDGGYRIRVNDIGPDGSVAAGYYNPNEIHIVQANVSLWKGLVKLFIKLQDTGYPGSTYTLYYYAEKDALAGFYYQAVLGQTYKVIFLRKQP
jgi:hypothetical protein